MGDLLQFPGNFRRSAQSDVELSVVEHALMGGPVADHNSRILDRLHGLPACHGTCDGEDRNPNTIEMPSDCPA